MATATNDTQALRRQALAGLDVKQRRRQLARIPTAVLEGGEGPPLILLHGPMASAAHWGSVLPFLLATHRVIAPDLPGHGASETGDGPLDADQVLAWLAELVDASCPEPPVLVGNALGGAIAARFAAEHGDRLAGLVLVDALGVAAFRPAPAFAQALEGFLAQPTVETHDRLWRHCAHDLDGLRERMGAQWGPFEAYNLDRARTPSVVSALGALMAEFGLPAIPSDTLRRIRVPTTLIWGRHDLATALPVAEAAAERLGWPLHVIEACADDPPVEQPEAFLDTLRAALAPARAPAPALRRRLRGPVLLPGQPGFETATRIWNGLATRTPALVVQPTDTADVVSAVAFARDEGLPVSVRGGGHHIAGTALAEGGLTIDLSPLRAVVVDPEARTATVEPGCRLGDVDRETQRHGLATPLGFVSEVGVAGLTLGGGLGYLTRRFGWTADNLLAAEIVTADGEVRRASREEHPDLFWGLRGAGANLGVVTSLTFRLHRVGPTVVGGLIAWPFERATEILSAYRDITADAPRELAVWMNFLRAPAAPFVPQRWHGELVGAMAVCYSGPVEEAGAVLAPIRALGDPAFDVLGPQPYTQVQSYLDAAEPQGDHYYWRSDYAAELSDELLATWRDLAAECPIPRAQIGILHLAGALNERAPDDGAVGNRDARYALGAIGIWDPGTPGEETFPAWIRGAWQRFHAFSTGGTYANFQTADEGEDRVRAAYGDNYDRLVAIKRRYDPDNLFRSNRNIHPRARTR